MNTNRKKKTNINLKTNTKTTNIINNDIDQFRNLNIFWINYFINLNKSNMNKSNKK